jgi:hypothetical protein
MNLKEVQNKLSSDISQLYETYQLISKNKKQFNELDVALLQQQLLYVYHSLLKVQSHLAQLPAAAEDILQALPGNTIVVPEPAVHPEAEPEQPETITEQPPVVIPEPEEEVPQVTAETHVPVVEPLPIVVDEIPEPTLDDLEKLMQEQEKQEEEQLSLLTPEPPKTEIPGPKEEPKPVGAEATISLLDKLTANMRTPDIHEKISRESQSLKQAINLNKKIAFVNNLFNENTVEYAKAIEKLNAATGAHEALRYFSELKHQYNWNNENPLVKDLEQLIERRFS